MCDKKLETVFKFNMGSVCATEEQVATDALPVRSGHESDEARKRKEEKLDEENYEEKDEENDEAKDEEKIPELSHTIKKFRDISALTTKKTKNADTLIIKLVENKQCGLFTAESLDVLVSIKKYKFEKPAEDLKLSIFFNIFKSLGAVLPEIKSKHRVTFEFSPKWNDLKQFDGKLDNMIVFLNMACGVNVIWPGYKAHAMYLSDFVAKAARPAYEAAILKSKKQNRKEMFHDFIARIDEHALNALEKNEIIEKFDLYEAKMIDLDNVYNDKLCLWHNIWWWYVKLIDIPCVSQAAYIYNLDENDINSMNEQTGFDKMADYFANSASKNKLVIKSHLTCFAKSIIGLDSKLGDDTHAVTRFRFGYNKNEDNIVFLRFEILFNGKLFNNAVKSHYATRVTSGVFGIGLFHEKGGHVKPRQFTNVCRQPTHERVPVIRERTSNKEIEKEGGITLELYLLLVQLVYTMDDKFIGIVPFDDGTMVQYSVRMLELDTFFKDLIRKDSDVITKEDLNMMNKNILCDVKHGIKGQSKGIPGQRNRDGEPSSDKTEVQTLLPKHFDDTNIDYRNMSDTEFDQLVKQKYEFEKYQPENMKKYNDGKCISVEVLGDDGEPEFRSKGDMFRGTLKRKVRRELEQKREHAGECTLM